jgi:hypothetical protein
LNINNIKNINIKEFKKDIQKKEKKLMEVEVNYVVLTILTTLCSDGLRIAITFIGILLVAKTGHLPTLQLIKTYEWPDLLDFKKNYNYFKVNRYSFFINFIVIILLFLGILAPYYGALIQYYTPSQSYLKWNEGESLKITLNKNINQILLSKTPYLSSGMLDVSNLVNEYDNSIIVSPNLKYETNTNMTDINLSYIDYIGLSKYINQLNYNSSGQFFVNTTNSDTNLDEGFYAFAKFSSLYTHRKPNVISYTAGHVRPDFLLNETYGIYFQDELSLNSKSEKTRISTCAIHNEMVGINMLGNKPRYSNGLISFDWIKYAILSNISSNGISQIDYKINNGYVITTSISRQTLNTNGNVYYDYLITSNYKISCYRTDYMVSSSDRLGDVYTPYLWSVDYKFLNGIENSTKAGYLNYTIMTTSNWPNEGDTHDITMEQLPVDSIDIDSLVAVSIFISSFDNISTTITNMIGFDKLIFIININWIIGIIIPIAFVIILRFLDIFKILPGWLISDFYEIASANFNGKFESYSIKQIGDIWLRYKFDNKEKRLYITSNDMEITIGNSIEIENVPLLNINYKSKTIE